MLICGYRGDSHYTKTHREAEADFLSSAHGEHAQEGHVLYTASLNNLLTYTEALRRELDGSGVSARFVQARIQSQSPDESTAHLVA